MWWDRQNILKLRIYIRIRLVNWQILTMAEGSSYIHEFETGEKAEYPNNPNPRKEKRTYSLFKIYSKNFTCHNRWNNTGEGLICSNERSISNTWNGWEPIKYRQTFARRNYSCPERAVVIFQPNLRPLSTFALERRHRVSISSKPRSSLCDRCGLLWSCRVSLLSFNYVRKLARPSPPTRAFCRVNCHHGREKKVKYNNKRVFRSRRLL